MKISYGRGRPKLTKQCKNEIIDLFFNTDRTMTQLSKQYDVSVQTVSRVIKGYKEENDIQDDQAL